MGSILFDAKDVCDHLIYKMASVREREERKKQISLSETPTVSCSVFPNSHGFSWPLYEHTITIISWQEDTFKETNTILIASIVKWQVKGEYCAQVFPFTLFFF